MNFTTYGTSPFNSNRGLRIGLLDSGANQSTNTGNASGENVRGYVQDMNYANVFYAAPLQTDADTNLNQANSLLNTTGNFAQIGSNGGGTTNDPGFYDGTNYTMIMSITEQETNSVSITTTFIGSTLTNGMISQTVTDTNYCYTNYDTFCVRPNGGSESATNFTTTSFEVATFPTPMPGIVMSLQSLETNTIKVLSWNSTAGATYSIYRTNLLTAPATNWAAITTGFPTGGATGGTIWYTDKPAGIMEFYRVSTP